MSNPPTSRPIGSRPAISRSPTSRPFVSRPETFDTAPLEEQASPSIIRLTRKNDAFSTDGGDEEIIDTRPPRPPSVQRAIATTPITLPHRKYQPDEQDPQILPELHELDELDEPWIVNDDPATNQPAFAIEMPGLATNLPILPILTNAETGNENAIAEPATDPALITTDMPLAADIEPAPTLTTIPQTSLALPEPVAPVTIQTLPENNQPPPPQSVKQLKRRLQTWRIFNLACAILLLALAGISLTELTLDITSPHLLISQINSANGTIQAQQDPGAKLPGGTLVSTPLQTPNGLVFGTQNGRQSQLITLHGSTLLRQNMTQQPTATAPMILNTTPDGNLLIKTLSGLQLVTPAGQQLWTIQGTQPTRGAHTFQPVFDRSNIYTVKSLYARQVAAYSLVGGQELWNQTLDDTLDYAPPFQVDAQQLYVASDHELTALSLTNGTLKWKIPLPTRTLLLASPNGTTVLLSAGPQGLTALDPSQGSLLWKKSIQPVPTTNAGTMTPVQFYQAALSDNGSVVYATGISWEAPRVLEHTWLAALNTTTGQILWSRPVASGFISADASRTLPLLVDNAHHQLIQQQIQDGDNRSIMAFDSDSGLTRWETHPAQLQSVAASVLQQSDGSLLLLGTTTNSLLLPASWSIWRIGLVVALGLSLLALGILWLVRWLLERRNHPRQPALKKERVHSPLRARRLLYTSLPTMTGVLLLLLITAATVLAYFDLNQANIYDGRDLRQGIADNSGNVFVSSVGNDMHRVIAVDTQGNTRWQTFTSEGRFSILPAAYPTQSTLIMLTGQPPQDYRFAPGDPAYPDPLDSLVTLYCFNRQSGTLTWQSTLNPINAQASVNILGADQQLIYIASLSTRSDNELQLFALNQASGNIAWIITVPHKKAALSTGILKGKGSERIWQVAGTDYTINTNTGKIVLH